MIIVLNGGITLWISYYSHFPDGAWGLKKLSDGWGVVELIFKSNLCLVSLFQPVPHTLGDYAFQNRKWKHEAIFLSNSWCLKIGFIFVSGLRKVCHIWRFGNLLYLIRGMGRGDPRTHMLVIEIECFKPLVPNLINVKWEHQSVAAPALCSGYLECYNWRLEFREHKCRLLCS